MIEIPEDHPTVKFHTELQKAFPILWRDDSFGRRTWPCAAKGWREIIWKCSEEISAEIKSVVQLYPIEVLPRATQVKEKFGGLRFYLSGIPIPIAEEVRKIRDFYEQVSYKTCDVCGGMGKIRNHWPEHPDVPFGWVRTLCEEHFIEEAERRVQSGGVDKKARKWYYDRRVALKAAKRAARKSNG